MNKLDKPAITLKKRGRKLGGTSPTRSPILIRLQALEIGEVLITSDTSSKDANTYICRNRDLKTKRFSTESIMLIRKTFETEMAVRIERLA